MNLGQDRIINQIVARLAERSRQGPVKVEGTWGSFAPLLVKHIFDVLRRPILYIRPHIDDADKAIDDLTTFGASRILPLPAWEGEIEPADATDEIRAERARLVAHIAQYKHALGPKSLVIPSSIQALQQPVPSTGALEQASLKLKTNMELPIERVIKWLVDNGFERVDRVDLPGQFAQRGGIIDIYAPLAVQEDFEGSLGQSAIRLEFFGDVIESIRKINLDTHRSTEQIDDVKITSVTCGLDADSAELFVNILPEDTIVVLEEPNEIEEVARVYIERATQSQQLYQWSQLYDALDKYTQLWLCRFAGSDAKDFFRLNIKSIQKFQQGTTLWSGHKQSLQELLNQTKDGYNVYFYCETQAEINRVTEILEQTGERIPHNFRLIKGFINQGFIIESLKTIVATHHELFGQFILPRRPRPVGVTAPVDTLEDLQVGDYVVHASYGIGRFRGVTTIRDKKGIGEYLTIEYADGVKVQVSVSNIHLIQKYIGTSPKRPPLNKLGSKRWVQQKQKVSRAVRDMAAELLEIQAKRQAIRGISYGPDSSWQLEFEELFPYQETADQITVAEQIKADMSRPVAMDRLLCGDVGYGKTELAMRAAFKAVESGKQVAVLVPTTVLSVQHGRTFSERFADFPVCIEVLNRFKTTKQAKQIIERTKQGKVDILIGTHRLLSDDVCFKDLGLVIIDEEQRFGVAHKEKLKKLRVNVDVLTMTATPIPRTLHMSLLGLRDISSLGTPPLDRRAIVTRVVRYDPTLIKQAIYREINRRGQVFFVHNRVKTIDKKAQQLRKLLGDDSIKIAVAHGQMHKRQLEDTMIDFVLGKIDVLVCTTIIESGLDIPNANTIFIDEADRFGLAELHQLRGRVGRYKHRAYAYMLLPSSRAITPVAVRRLKAIEEYSHLGAGFKIALRDLEIRGAGNILGPEQSGHIQTVGYQMYCALLAEAVKRLKGEPVEKIPMANIDIGLSAYIPKNYIPSDRSRLEVYRKIAVAKSLCELSDIKAELSDVYGPLPEEVELFLELAELRVMAAKAGIKSIVLSGNNLIFSIDESTKPDIRRLFSKDLLEHINARIDIVGSSTIYLRLKQNHFNGQSLISLLWQVLAQYQRQS